MSAEPPSAEIAAIRRRYLLMATSISRSISRSPSSSRDCPAPGACAAHARRRLVLLLAVNWTSPAGCSRRSRATSRAGQLRRHAAPAHPAAAADGAARGDPHHGAHVFRLSVDLSLHDPGVTEYRSRASPDRYAYLVLPVFYFTYTYFVISDYLANLCIFIFGATARTSASSSAVIRPSWSWPCW